MQKIFYVTSIREKSVSGDRVHVENIVKESDFIHFNLRFLSLYWFIIKKHKEKIILRESIDILFLCAVFPSTFLRYFFKNIVVEINGSIVDEKELYFIKYAQRKLLKLSKKIIFVSIGLKKRFIELYTNDNEYKSIVVNNGGEKVERTRNTITNSTIRLVYVGAKTKWQDVDGVIQWLLSNKDNLQNNISFNVAGPGFEEYENYSGKNLHITFEGPVPKSRAKLIYQSCNILVCPDKRSYFGYLLSSPIKVYECINMGLLVTFFHPWKYKKEFGFANNQIVTWSDALKLDVIENTLNNIEYDFRLRTWKDVVDELNMCMNDD